MNQFFLCSPFCARGYSCVVDWEDSRGKCGAWLVTSSEGRRKGAELCVYFVLYFSRFGGFQEESSVDLGGFQEQCR